MLDGVLLCSGGFDSAAYGILLKKAGLDLQPVYVSHRPNVGNVTKKEIVAASKYAQEVFGRRLLILKPKAKGKEPAWWCDYGDVAFTTKMPVPMSEKRLRNRRFIETLREHDLDRGVVAIGLLGTNERTPKNRLHDEEHDLLARRVRGELMTPQKTFGHLPKLETKIALLKAIGKKAPWPRVMWDSTSCRLYFRKSCGRCWGCKERAIAFMTAWGEDKTDYRKGEWADRYRRGLVEVPATLPDEAA